MSAPPAEIRRWPALWSLVLGFFMILVDTTIVSVANPSIMRALDTSMVATLWATSAFLLAYAVPLLITGRLGDRFGPKRVYLLGLSVFTLASLACGLAPSIEALIGARVVQGLGAALLTPQTMAVITRIFPPRERGSAMAIWGVTSGVAMLVGPILGGLLLDAGGWEWIFFINVPVGVVGFVLAARFVPNLPTHAQRLDWLGVVLSAVGMLLLVFGIQEGESYDWGVIVGPVTVWSLIISGVVVLALFVVWQRVQRGEPLLPLGIFRDRNFSVGSGTIVTVGMSVTAMGVPLMFAYQLVYGLSPTQSALMLAPMAVLAGVLARPVGRIIDRRDPRRLATIGLSLVGASLLLYALLLRPDTPVWWLLVPSTILGIANSLMWGPLATITMFSLPREFSGAGSGVYNTSRQVGAVLGSAIMAVVLQARVTAQLGEEAGGGGSLAGQGPLPESLRAGYAAAMAEAILMPAIIILLGAVLTLFFAPRPRAVSGEHAMPGGDTPR